MIYHLIFVIILILISEYFNNNHNDKYVKTIDGERFIPIDNKNSWLSQILAFWAIGIMNILVYRFLTENNLNFF